MTLLLQSMHLRNPNLRPKNLLEESMIPSDALFEDLQLLPPVLLRKKSKKKGRVRGKETTVDSRTNKGEKLNLHCATGNPRGVTISAFTRDADFITSYTIIKARGTFRTSVTGVSLADSVLVYETGRTTGRSR